MSYDPEAFRIAEEIIRWEQAKRKQLFDEALGRAKSEAAKHGAIGGSGHLSVIADTCANEVESSAARAWEVVHRSLLTTGVSPHPELAPELRRRMEDILRVYCMAEPERIYHEALRAFPNCKTSFSERAISARMRILTEVELFARSLQRQAIPREPGTIINNYAPVGSIQTGANSRADVIQNFSQTDRQAILAALDRIQSDLSRSNELTADRASEIAEVIIEARAELEKPKPHRLLSLAKLKALADSIAATKTIAGGYEMLKTALAAHGIFLP